MLAAALGAAPAAAADFDLARLNDGGTVLLLRHVKAGGADSDDFDLKNCRTQREVGAAGRKQAAELAARFKAAGITAARVLSSQWCRALQTAELLGLGPVEEAPALNYYHWKLGSEDAMKDALRRFFIELPAPAPGAPVVLVSHTTAFGAIGVEAPKSGGGLVLRPNGTAAPEVVGAISAPE
ncbi:MAG: hypothetical protein Kow00114_05620 [Kiloniellaceae bacterium]